MKTKEAEHCLGFPFACFKVKTSSSKPHLQSWLCQDTMVTDFGSLFIPPHSEHWYYEGQVLLRRT